MFCPSCATEELQATQYCRVCGTDLRAVRVSIERPESVTTSAVSAREEIGHAVAQKIRELQNAKELKRVAEDVLPEIEKFLESHEEKRLRRIRAGVIVSASGIGTCLLGLVMAAALNGPEAEKALTILGLGAIAFAIGLALVMNGLLFTRPNKRGQDDSPDARWQNLLHAGEAPKLRPSNEVPSFRAQTTSNLSPAPGSSITEHTTHHLKQER
jgi:hypothetical protein